MANENTPELPEADDLREKSRDIDKLDEREDGKVNLEGEGTEQEKRDSEVYISKVDTLLTLAVGLEDPQSQSAARHYLHGLLRLLAQIPNTRLEARNVLAHLRERFEREINVVIDELKYPQYLTSERAQQVQAVLEQDEKKRQEEPKAFFFALATRAGTTPESTESALKSYNEALLNGESVLPLADMERELEGFLEVDRWLEMHNCGSRSPAFFGMLVHNSPRRSLLLQERKNLRDFTLTKAAECYLCHLLRVRTEQPHLSQEEMDLKLTEMLAVDDWLNTHHLVMSSGNLFKMLIRYLPKSSFILLEIHKLRSPIEAQKKSTPERNTEPHAAMSQQDQASPLAHPTYAVKSEVLRAQTAYTHAAAEWQPHSKTAKRGELIAETEERLFELRRQYMVEEELIVLAQCKAKRREIEQTILQASLLPTKNASGEETFRPPTPQETYDYFSAQYEEYRSTQRYFVCEITAIDVVIKECKDRGTPAEHYSTLIARRAAWEERLATADANMQECRKNHLMAGADLHRNGVRGHQREFLRAGELRLVEEADAKELSTARLEIKKRKEDATEIAKVGAKLGLDTSSTIFSIPPGEQPGGYGKQMNELLEEGVDTSAWFLSNANFIQASELTLGAQVCSKLTGEFERRQTDGSAPPEQIFTQGIMLLTQIEALRARCGKHGALANNAEGPSGPEKRISDVLGRLIERVQRIIIIAQSEHPTIKGVRLAVLRIQRALQPIQKLQEETKEYIDLVHKEQLKPLTDAERAELTRLRNPRRRIGAHGRDYHEQKKLEEREHIVHEGLTSDEKTKKRMLEVRGGLLLDRYPSKKTLTMVKGILDDPRLWEDLAFVRTNAPEAIRLLRSSTGTSSDTEEGTFYARQAEQLKTMENLERKFSKSNGELEKSHRDLSKIRDAFWWNDFCEWMQTNGVIIVSAVVVAVAVTTVVAVPLVVPATYAGMAAHFAITSAAGGLGATLGTEGGKELVGTYYRPEIYKSDMYREVLSGDYTTETWRQGGRDFLRNTAYSAAFTGGGHIAGRLAPYLGPPGRWLQNSAHGMEKLLEKVGRTATGKEVGEELFQEGLETIASQAGYSAFGWIPSALMAIQKRNRGDVRVSAVPKSELTFLGIMEVENFGDVGRIQYGPGTTSTAVEKFVTETLGAKNISRVRVPGRGDTLSFDMEVEGDNGMPILVRMVVEQTLEPLTMRRILKDCPEIAEKFGIQFDEKATQATHFDEKTTGVYRIDPAHAEECREFFEADGCIVTLAPERGPGAFRFQWNDLNAVFVPGPPTIA